MLAKQIESAHPETNRGRGVIVTPARGADPRRRADTPNTLELLAGAVALVLLIVCANIAGLLLARNLSRAREFALRLSLGASRRRLVRELVTESLLLGLIGGGLGLAVAVMCNRVIAGFYAGPLTWFELRLNPAVLGLALAITLGTVFTFGLVPALRASRTDLMVTLKNEGQTPSGGRSRLRDALLVLQVAVALVLAVDAILLTRSLRHVFAGERFDPNHVVVMRLRPALIGYGFARGRAFQAEVVRRLEATPGVISVSPALFAGNQANQSVSVWLPGRKPVDPDREAPVFSNVVGPQFFATLGVRPLSGREFETNDVAGQPPVVMVNEAAARRFWGSASPIGALLTVDSLTSIVVGVVPDFEYRAAGEPARPVVFRNYWQTDTTDVFLAESRTHVRVSGDPRAMLSRLREVVSAVDRDVPIADQQTLLEWLAGGFQPIRLVMTLLGYFAGLAVFLSAFGLYGVLAFRVAQRTKEIGIRVALGAGRGRVTTLILGRGVALVLTGCAIGIVGAVGSLPLLRNMLYGVESLDPLVFAVAPLLLVAVAAVASYFPASRAARVDPLLALRTDC
jgi:predicted permease